VAIIFVAYKSVGLLTGPSPNPLATDPRYLEDLPEERVEELLRLSNEYRNYAMEPGRATKADFEHLVAQLLRKYPFQSLVPRLAGYRSASTRRPTGPLSAEAEHNLDEFEMVTHLSGPLGEYAQMRRPGYMDRALILKDLHEGTVETFVSQQGFGVYRMRSGPHPFIDDHFPIVQPRNLPEYVDAKFDFAKYGPDDSLHDDLLGMHTGMRNSFIFEYGWGYVRSKKEVAGFQSHRVGRISLYDPWEAETHNHYMHEFEPHERKQWQIDSVQLVGLLKHEMPVVYVLENLPDMDQIKDSPTRHLSEWEIKALNSLYNGKDFEVVNEPEHIKALGAIRANTECLQCHDGKRGDMLGAFTYRISKVRYVPSAPASDSLSQYSR
jgi:hypothetical protein